MNTTVYSCAKAGVAVTNGADVVLISNNISLGQDAGVSVSAARARMDSNDVFDNAFPDVRIDGDSGVALVSVGPHVTQPPSG